MTETGYNETYDNQGNVIESEPFTVSDELILIRDAQEQINTYHLQVLDYLGRWGQLNDNQKDDLLKHLARFYLVAGQQLGYFTVE